METETDDEEEAVHGRAGLVKAFNRSDVIAARSVLK